MKLNWCTLFIARSLRSIVTLQFADFDILYDDGGDDDDDNDDDDRTMIMSHQYLYQHAWGIEH